MQIYSYKIEYMDNLAQEVVQEEGFVIEKSYQGAMAEISNIYGEGDIMRVGELELVADSTLGIVFSNSADDLVVFEAVKKHLTNHCF